MDNKVKRRQELDLQIKNRKEKIKSAAIQCFKDHGIENTKISDIAKAAGVGEATIYRYFETKPRLVIDCAVDVWKTELELLLAEAELQCEKDADGFSKLSGIFEMIGSIYERKPILLSLLEQLDNFIIKEKIPEEELTQFESAISCTAAYALRVIREGREDGSIRSDFNESLFYMSAGHAVLSLSQRLLLRGNILISDRKEGHQAEIDFLINALLSFVKGTKK